VTGLSGLRGDFAQITDILTSAECDVYSHLQDELSRRVFMTRKSFALGANVDFGEIFEDGVKSTDELKLRLEGKTFAVYGAGDGGQRFLKLATKFDLLHNCRAIYDRNSALHGATLVGITISPFPPAMTTADIIVVSPMLYTVSSEIKESLLASGIIGDKLISFCEYMATDDLDIYFDEVILNSLGGDEIFVDGGCLDFNTSLMFLKHCPRAAKIYAIEPNPAQITTVERNILRSGFSKAQIITSALGSGDAEFFFEADGTSSHLTSEATSVKVVVSALDDLVRPNEKITFIKMDIEGSELEALKGCQRTIRAHRPKLAISIYHNPDDYICLPRYIISLVPEYKLYMRHYSSFSSSESVLYAI
jgi:FkbM family methyltransferase